MTDAENIDLLVMMRSGREHRIAVTPAEKQELLDHPDIGPGRIYVLGMTTQYTGIPRNRLFPGIKLTKEKLPRQTRPRKVKPVQPVGPLGYIEWYSGPLTQGVFNSRREKLLQE